LCHDVRLRAGFAACAGFVLVFVLAGQGLAGAAYESRSVSRDQHTGEPRVFTDPTAPGAKFFYLGPGADSKGNNNTLFWWSSDGAHWSGPALTNQANGGNDSDIAVDTRHTVYVADLADPAGNSSIPISVWNPSTHRFSRVGIVSPGSSGFDREWIASPSANSVVAIARDGGNEHVWVSTDGARHFGKQRDVDTGVAVAGPLVTGKASPGHPAPLYFTYVKGSDLRLAKSTDGGHHWGTYRIAANQSVALFPVVASDSTANLYAAWSGDDPVSGNSGVIMVSTSRDGGRTWRDLRAVSDNKKDPLGDAPTAVFPWIVAGNTGRVDVTFAIEHPVLLNSFEGPEAPFPGTTWDLRLAQSTDANGSRPTWTGTLLKADFHAGSICTLGIACPGPQQFGLLNAPTPFDRRDLDFFGSALDGSGRLYAPYCADVPISPTDPNTVISSAVDLDVVRQIGGTTLGSNGR
jgi:hypothetical protein